MRTGLRRALTAALAVIVALTVVAFTPSSVAYAAQTPPAADLAALAGAAATNAFRTSLGLPALSTNAALAAAAKSHSQYLLNHNVIGHGEDTADSDSTGNSPADRAAYFGYSSWAYEVLNWLSTPSTTGDSVQLWIDTLYHRIAYLDPRIHEQGFGLATGGSGAYSATQDFGALNWNYSWSKPILYPVDGQTGVPTSWDASESPNPLRLFPGALDAQGNPKGPTGPVLTASFFDGTVTGTAVTSASLTGADGSTPAFWTLSSANDDELRETVSLIPQAPLKPDTAYTVHITGTYKKSTLGAKTPFDVTWTFRTAQAGTVTGGQLGATWDSAKGAFVWTMTVKGTQLSTASKAFFGGLPCAVQHQADGTLRIQLGASYSLTSRAGLEVVWPDGSMAAYSGYWQADSSEQIKPQTTTATVTVAGQTRSVKQAAYSACTWTEADAALFPGAEVENIGDVHFLRYGSHILEWDASSRVAYVDGVRSVLPFAPLSSGGVNYLPATWLSPIVEQWASGGTGGTPAAVTFSDIANHWAKADIVRLAAAGIVGGNGDGTFGPDSQLTRAAFVKMLVNADGLVSQPGDSAGFTDAASHWVVQQGYLGAAVKAGIVKLGDYAGGRFEPDRAITRDEIAMLVVRALGLEAQAQAENVAVSSGEASIDGSLFSDAGQWSHAGYAVTAIHSGIVRGYLEADGSYTFRPTRTATRAEAVTMIVRMLDRAAVK